MMSDALRKEVVHGLSTGQTEDRRDNADWIVDLIESEIREAKINLIEKYLPTVEDLADAVGACYGGDVPSHVKDGTDMRAELDRIKQLRKDSRE